jgi:hypothetical protein
VGPTLEALIDPKGKKLSDKEETIKKFLDNYNKLSESGLTSAGKVYLSDKEIEQIARSVNESGTIDEKDVEYAITHGPKSEREGKTIALETYISMLKSIKKSTKDKAQLDEQLTKGGVGPLEHSIKTKRIQNDAIGEGISTPGYTEQDLTWFIRASSDDEKQALANELFNKAQSDPKARQEYEDLYRGWEQYINEAAQKGDTRLSTPTEVFQGQKKQQESYVASPFDEQAVDLAKMSATDRTRMFQQAPQLTQQLGGGLQGALDYTARRQEGGLITPSSAKSTSKALSKLLGGDLSSGSSSGSGRGGRKRSKGGRKGGKKGKKITVKKGRAGRKPRLTVPKTQSNVLNNLLKKKKSKRVGVLANLGI